MKKRIVGIVAAVVAFGAVAAPAALASPNTQQFTGINCSITAQSPYQSGGQIHLDSSMSCAGSVGITSKKFDDLEVLAYYSGGWHFWSEQGGTGAATANPDPWYNHVPCGVGVSSWKFQVVGDISKGSNDYGSGVESFAGPGC